MRRRGGKGTVKVETVTLDDASVNVYLRRTDGMFYAHWDGKTTENKSLPILRDQVKNYLSGSAVEEWIPVLQIRTGDKYADEETSSSLELHYGRYWVSQRKDGRWFKNDWETIPELRVKEKSSFTVYWAGEYQTISVPMYLKPSKPDPDSEAGYWHILPYDENLWQSLEAMSAGLRTIQGKLDKLLTSDEGRKRLVQSKTKFLLSE